MISTLSKVGCRMAVLFFTWVLSGSAQSPPAELEKLLNDAVRFTFEKFADKKLTTNQLAVTLVDLRDANAPVQASYRGDAQIYPASVVKLFYLAAAQRWMEDGKL